MAFGPSSVARILSDAANKARGITSTSGWDSSQYIDPTEYLPNVQAPVRAPARAQVQAPTPVPRPSAPAYSGPENWGMPGSKSLGDAIAMVTARRDAAAAGRPMSDEDIGQQRILYSQEGARRSLGNLLQNMVSGDPRMREAALNAYDTIAARQGAAQQMFGPEGSKAFITNERADQLAAAQMMQQMLDERIRSAMAQEALAGTKIGNEYDLGMDTNRTNRDIAGIRNQPAQWKFEMDRMAEENRASEANARFKMLQDLISGQLGQSGEPGQFRGIPDAILGQGIPGYKSQAQLEDDQLDRKNKQMRNQMMKNSLNKPENPKDPVSSNPGVMANAVLAAQGVDPEVVKSRIFDRVMGTMGVDEDGFKARLTDPETYGLVVEEIDAALQTYGIDNPQQAEALRKKWMYEKGVKEPSQSMGVKKGSGNKRGKRLTGLIRQGKRAFPLWLDSLMPGSSLWLDSLMSGGKS